MTKGRLEAFSDGVVAILITIMVLELRAPLGGALADLAPLLPTFLSYTLSFVFIGIYWDNHHHLMHAAQKVNGPVPRSNMFLLFWLSLVPFAKAWMGANAFTGFSVALYGIVLWLAGIAYCALSRALISLHGADSLLAQAIGRDRKGLTSLILYTLAIGMSFVIAPTAMAIYVFVAVMWFLPDRRIESRFNL